jgi:hypothetical protein
MCQQLFLKRKSKKVWQDPFLQVIIGLANACFLTTIAYLKTLLQLVNYYRNLPTWLNSLSAI